MSLTSDISALETRGLIHPVVSGAQVEYRFRHALVHEAAYSTLLKQHRRELHQAVGEVLEADYGPATEEMASVLGFHFNEAGDTRRASRYFAAAGAQAARKYAHHEAISYYSQAIRAVVQPPASLFQARGQVFDLQGDFEAARLDFEHSAEVAQAAGDLPAEWQALLSLGLLWSGRDYDRSGDYCRLAFELAEKTGQPGLVARSYNRLGNWHLNAERPLEAARCHNQALSIFQFLHDDKGIAETLDLLGMASLLGGDLDRGVAYYQQAIDLNRRLDDRLALAHVMGSQILTANSGYQTMTLRPSSMAGADLFAQSEQAVRVMHEIGWRDGEAFLNMIVSFHSQSRGDYARALQAGKAGLAIAMDIDHRQWMAGCHYSLGLIHYDLLALPQARQHLESGLALSREIRSQHWTRCHIGILAVVYVECGSPDQAEALLSTASGIRQPPQTLGERLVTYGHACLARARGDLDGALAAVDLLVTAGSSGAPAESVSPIPFLFLLRGALYGELGRIASAEADFRAAIQTSTANRERPLLWRLHKALGQLLEKKALPVEAAEQFALARSFVAEMAAGLPDSDLRDNMRRRSGLFD